MTDFSPAFLGMFESLRMGPTFARGRRDERAGHVRSLTVSGSLVVALVRGPDDPSAFRARIAVRAFGASEWARVEKTLASEARYVADLLDGRMPPGIDAVFAEAGLGLLPLSLDEVAMDCTCERWPMPCAHLAATCYALARAFESDPFEVFTWRGRPRDELLMRLRRLREASAVDSSKGAGSGGATSRSGGVGETTRDDGSEGDRAAAGRPVPAADPATFWGDTGWSETSGAGTFARAAGGTAAGGAAGKPGAGGAAGKPGAGGAAGKPGAGGAAGELAAGDRAATRAAGRQRLHGAAADGAGAEVPGAFGEPEGAGAPGFYATGEGRMIRPDALLDQLDAPGLTHGGRPVTEVLRVAYQALPDSSETD